MKTDGGLRPLFRQNIMDIFWTTVETGATAAGVPDSFGIRGGKPFWQENKWTEAVAVNFEPGQFSWHLRYARYGGKSFIAVRQLADPGARREGRDNLFLYRGADIMAVNEKGLNFPPLGSWMGGPANWDWRAVRRLLLAT